MFFYLRFAVITSLVICAGCNSRPTTVAIQGTVAYQGRAVDRGVIDFVPIENTPGASAGASIKDGHYEVDRKWGLHPEGVYLVRITALRKTGRTIPNTIKRGDPPLEESENFIPAAYNTQSTLKIRVADLADMDKVDFQLP